MCIVKHLVTVNAVVYVHQCMWLMFKYVTNAFFLIILSSVGWSCFLCWKTYMVLTSVTCLRTTCSPTPSLCLPDSAPTELPLPQLAERNQGGHAGSSVPWTHHYRESAQQLQDHCQPPSCVHRKCPRSARLTERLLLSRQGYSADVPHKVHWTLYFLIKSHVW